MNTLRYHLELKTVFISLIAAAISLSFVFGSRYYQTQSRVVSAIPITVEDFTPPTSQISSDGAKQLLMKITSNNNTTKTYVFSVSDGSGGNEQEIFRKTLVAKKSMLIPYNTWSSDNNYFFIRESGEEGDTIMVFDASGEPFASKEKYLNLTELFRQSGDKNKFSEATGWAANNLIIFNTITPENTKGPSYWFEVPSKAILQLGLQF